MAVTHRPSVFEQTQLCSLFNWDVSLNVGKRAMIQQSAGCLSLLPSPCSGSATHKVTLLAGNMLVFKRNVNTGRFSTVWFRCTFHMFSKMRRFKGSTLKVLTLVDKLQTEVSVLYCFACSIFHQVWAGTRTRTQPEGPMAHQFQQEAKTQCFSADRGLNMQEI